MEIDRISSQRSIKDFPVKGSAHVAGWSVGLLTQMILSMIVTLAAFGYVAATVDRHELDPVETPLVVAGYQELYSPFIPLGPQVDPQPIPPAPIPRPPGVPIPPTPNPPPQPEPIPPAPIR